MMVSWLKEREEEGALKGERRGQMYEEETQYAAVFPWTKEEDFNREFSVLIWLKSH